MLICIIGLKYFKWNKVVTYPVFMFPIQITRWCLKRFFVRYSQNVNLTMQAWQASKYGNPEVLNVNVLPNVPIVSKPTDVLIKVHASSVNPIDVMMLSGYGASIIGTLKQIKSLSLLQKPPIFPLTLGRDFAGTVVRTGSCVKNLSAGDEVWGVVGVEDPGSHAEYVVTSSCYATKKPSALSDIEAASIPYAALTAWSALSTFGGLTSSTSYGKRVLVIGAAGGVGTIAVQILKAWGAEVTAICSTDAVDLVHGLRADHVIDYQLQDMQSELKNLERFDFILDAIGSKNLSLMLDFLKKWKNSKYVTIVSPLLRNADDYGLVLGTIKSSAEAAQMMLTGFKDGRSARWAYFIPNGCALETITDMVNNKMITPVIDKVFKFEDTPDAYRKVLGGHARGKTVISNVDIPQEYQQQQLSPLTEEFSNADIKVAEKL